MSISASVKHNNMLPVSGHTYRDFICVSVFKVLLHYGDDCVLKVPLIQRRNHRLIHTVFLSKHKINTTFWYFIHCMVNLNYYAN